MRYLSAFKLDTEVEKKNDRMTKCNSTKLQGVW